jgi:glycosyltransferase involved in cell wall biosynthesis
LKDTFFIFCSPQYDKDYLNKCLKRICDLNIYDRFKIYTNKTSLAPLYPKVDLFIRPTITDSYGISVEEALEAGIPAIASDTCERAEGAILYETGNIKELCYKVDSVMKGLLKATVKRNNKNGKLDEYLTLYSIGRKAM